jgi:hypothetical protein
VKYAQAIFVCVFGGTSMRQANRLVTLWGTPVKVQPIVLVNLVILWAAVTWLGRSAHPERSLWTALLVGLVSTALLMFADFGHAIAHILSARYAGAPMDEVLISAGMPRTLYFDNNVPPAAHRTRALGGPIFSLLGFLLSLLLYVLSWKGSIARELSGWSLLGHALILLGSLAPLPVVDGGSILKWTLVERGRTPVQADQIIRRIDWLLGFTLGVLGAVLFVLRLWTAGLLVIALGAVVIGIAAGKIK